MKKENKYEGDHLVAPTVVVGWKTFNELKYGNPSRFTIHGRKGIRYVPDDAQEMGDDIIIFPRGVRYLTFRKRFTRQSFTKKVRFTTADKSRRYDLIFIFHF